MINQATPFVSFKDIDKGARWDGEIKTALTECICGVVFLCRDNLNAPWLLYESGALAKSTEKSYCCTYLIDIAPGDVKQPLGGLMMALVRPVAQ